MIKRMFILHNCVFHTTDMCLCNITSILVTNNGTMHKVHNSRNYAYVYGIPFDYNNVLKL
jgi:hypothetical protein